MGQRIFVVGASVGGVQALTELVRELPSRFPGTIFITLHVGAWGAGLLPEILTRAGHLPVSYAEHGQSIAAGHVYVAPPDRHMLLREGQVWLSHGPRENHTRPAIDPLFRSAAMNYGPAVVATVLTGYLDDGTVGALAVKDRGGTVIVQDPSEAIARSMPDSALRHVRVDHCCRLHEMAPLFRRLAEDPPADPPSPSPQARALAEIEDRIAAGIFTIGDWPQLESLSRPSGLNCPDCRSALYELPEPRLLRFRCRSGHAYSIESLLSGQAEAREAQLHAILGALMEELTLLRRLQAQAAGVAQPQLTLRMDERAIRLERDAAQISDWLQDVTGWAGPEGV